LERDGAIPHQAYLKLFGQLDGGGHKTYLRLFKALMTSSVTSTLGLA
jgi:hypothetical protein